MTSSIFNITRLKQQQAAKQVSTILYLLDYCIRLLKVLSLLSSYYYCIHF